MYCLPVTIFTGNSGIKRHFVLTKSGAPIFKNVKIVSMYVAVSKIEMRHLFICKKFKILTYNFSRKRKKNSLES